MNVEEIIRESIPKVNVMQFASCTNNQPWVCNLHYVSDDDLNLYWLSTPERRHSKELEINPRASAVIMVHENTKAQDYVVGISIEGQAKKVDWHKYEDIIEKYRKKHGSSKPFLDAVVSGENPHKVYVLEPTKFVLFDNKDFPEKPRQEWTLSK